MNLIEMLRNDGPDKGLQLQAADEIERLRAALQPDSLRYAIEHAGFGTVSDGEMNEILRKLGMLTVQ